MENKAFKDYYNLNYGLCSKKPCSCLRQGWPTETLLCKEFRSFNISEYEDLISNMENIKQKILNEENY